MLYSFDSRYSPPIVMFSMWVATHLHMVDNVLYLFQQVYHTYHPDSQLQELLKRNKVRCFLQNITCQLQN